MVTKRIDVAPQYARPTGPEQRLGDGTTRQAFERGDRRFERCSRRPEHRTNGEPCYYWEEVTA